MGNDHLRHLCDGVRATWHASPAGDRACAFGGVRSVPRDGSAGGHAPSGPSISPPLTTARSSCSSEVYWTWSGRAANGPLTTPYDKRHYDRLLTATRGGARPPARVARYQRRSVRFLENHDELRIATVFSPAEHRARAARVPGARLRFFHEASCTAGAVGCHMTAAGPAGDARRAGRGLYGQVLECCGGRARRPVALAGGGAAEPRM